MLRHELSLGILRNISIEQLISLTVVLKLLLCEVRSMTVVEVVDVGVVKISLARLAVQVLGVFT